MKDETEAIKHSLRKWQGLTKANLTKHNLFLEENVVCEKSGKDSLEIDCDSCALCCYFESDCYECPLGEYLEGSCDDDLEDEDGSGEDGPYQKFRKTGSPIPMIQALKATLAKNKKEKR